MKFIEQYNNEKNIRYSSYKFALSEAYKRNHKILVETGVSRGKIKFLFFSKPNWKDGMSTLIFGNYANYVNGELFSCDIEKKNIDNAKLLTSKFSKNINFINDNSINFLKNFKKRIDFLYLDSLDGQFDSASTHQLNEIKAAEDKLNNNSLVLLDDKGSKTNLSIDYMLNKKFNIINETNEQVLLSYSL
ncbi:MAG: class I SAM-dependent methyltransferase [Candidatus Pelagibacterales bacterium]|nr:MAG: class I SAM-dependent methyltransferase [Pelagibacterales bacterium]